MSTSAKAVARGLFAAAALIAIMLTPTATGVSQAGGMRASGGGMRSAGSLGAGRVLGAPGGARAAMPGVRVRATASGVTVRSASSNEHLIPPTSFVVRPLAPGTVIVPFSSAFLPFSSFFSGSVISPIIPGTVVNPLFPGTIFVPLFPTAAVRVLPNNVFVPIFPNLTVLPTFQGTTFITFPSSIIALSTAPSLISPLPPGIVPPLVPQFIVLPLQKALVSEEHEAQEEPNGNTGSGLTVGQLQMHRAAGSTMKQAGVTARSAPAARVSGGLMQAAAQTSEARALQEWVRTQNAGARPAGPVWGTSAQPAPGGASSPDMGPANGGTDPGAIESAFGRPKHRVTFVPRTAFFDDFFTINDGRLGFKQFRHHPVVTGDYYYAGYTSDPSWFAFDHPGDYPSVYALWGWTPPWVSSDRVSLLPPNGMGGISYPDSVESMSDADLAGAWNSIGGIRKAWLTGDPQWLAPYLSSQQDIGVYFNGKYGYSTSARDFYGMTVDAIHATRTAALALETPMWLSTGEVIVTGRNGFRGPDGNLRTVYVSYRLRKLGDGWRITDFGSSLTPMESDGREFAS